MAEEPDIVCLGVRDVHASHAVTLIGDLASGRVLFWHRSAMADATEAVQAWGKPVGSAWGTWLEMWLVNHQQAQLFFPSYLHAAIGPRGREAR